MTENKLENVMYGLLFICAITITINIYVAAILALIVCGIQQLRIDAIKKEARSAESQATVYKTFIQKQLRRYKEGIFNGKTASTDGKTI